MVLLQSTDGRVWSLDSLDIEKARHCPLLSFPVPCPSTIASMENESVVLVGLSMDGKIFQGAAKLTEKVTSMAKHVDRNGQESLLLTTRDNHLLIKPFAKLLDQAAPPCNGQRCRFLSYSLATVFDSHRDELARPMKRSGATAGMHAAMTPLTTPSPSNSFFTRPIEQGACLIASPPGSRLSFSQSVCRTLVNRKDRHRFSDASRESGGYKSSCLRRTRSSDALGEERFCIGLEIGKDQQCGSECAGGLSLATIPRGRPRLCHSCVLRRRLPSFHSPLPFNRLFSFQGLCYLMIALTKGSFFGPESPYWMYLPEGEDASLATNPAPDKVSSACEALRNAMIELNERQYFKAIVLSYARSVRYAALSSAMFFRADVILQI